MFVSRHWRKEAVAFRRPFREPLGTTAEVFAGLLEVGRRLRAGDRRIHLRFHSGARPRSIDTPRRLPAARDGSLDGYARRLGSEFGVVVGDFQALHEGIFARTADFLAGLYEQVGVPPGGALLDLFFEDRRRGIFGVHKDSQDVFTFVVAGRKRFLVWPFEALRAAVGAPAAARHRAFVAPPRFDPEPHRGEAVLLEGGPGDLFYWPADAWHVAEAAGDGAPVTTLALGLFLRGNPLEHAVAAAARAIAEGGPLVRPFGHARGGGAARPVRAAAGAVRRALASAAVAAQLEEGLLAFSTGLGFTVLPEPLPAAPLADRDRVRIARPGALAWMRAPGGDGGTLVIAAGGRVLRSPAHPGVLRLLETLDRGEPVRVGEVDLDLRAILAALLCRRGIVRLRG